MENNELNKLYAFMKKYKNDKKKSGQNIPWTHAMTYDPYGAYDIPENLLQTFYNLYVNAIVAGFQPHITEAHKEYGPIVIDFDFVQSKENAKRFYDENMIKEFIKLYNSIILKYLSINSNCMSCYVLEKKNPTIRQGTCHDGIHIVYPYICTKPSIQMLMRSNFIKIATKRKLFEKIPLINDIESVFDKNVIYSTGWMLYGSRKNISSLPYYITHIYNTANKNPYDILIPGTNILSKEYVKHFVNALSCRRFNSINEMSPISENINIEIIDNKINKLKDRIIDGDNKTEELVKLLGEDINFIKVIKQDEYIEAKNLVKLFSKKRATDYYQWYQVGKCLHNIDYRLIDDWILFSKLCPNKFKKGECEMIWKKIRPSNYTMATLHYFALKDNPEQYQKMKEKKLSKLLRDGEEASHNTIAKFLMEKYKYTFRCASIKHNLWFEFKNHRWIEIDSAFSLRNLISDELVLEYAKKQNDLYILSADKQGRDKQECLSEAGIIGKVIRQLNNSSFKNGVIRECADISYDRNFLKNLDENIYLICFENGIYDLEANIFREGCPDDYISLCTNYKYLPYDPRDEITKDINDFLQKIQPDSEMKNYLLTLLSTCLAGSISEESFYVFTGSGANGKSKLMELMKYTLGDLFKPMDIRLLTEKRASSSAASPELADKKGIRACPFDEPKATDEINTGFMKIFTGGDVITARALFKEPIYFKPQFKPFLLCNHLPNIKSDDDGTWRRLKVVPFQSKFIKPTEATKKQQEKLEINQFWADNLLSEKLPEWRENFMGMLIQFYNKYRKNGLIHPNLVTQQTAEYRKRCDIFQDFLGDYLDNTNDSKNTISTSDLHDGMRTWHKSNYEGKCPNTKELRNYLQQRLPSYNNKTDLLSGYKIKTYQNEEKLDDLDTIDL